MLNLFFSFLRLGGRPSIILRRINILLYDKSTTTHETLN